MATFLSSLITDSGRSAGISRAARVKLRYRGQHVSGADDGDELRAHTAPRSPRATRRASAEGYDSRSYASAASIFSRLPRFTIYHTQLKLYFHLRSRSRFFSLYYGSAAFDEGRVRGTTPVAPSMIILYIK